MRIGVAIRHLHHGEGGLAELLTQVSDRHRTDHEIFHLGRDLAGWSRAHVAELARAGHERGLDLDPEVDDEPGPLHALRQKAAEVLGGRPEPGLMLLADLRRLYLAAAGVSLDWEILAQAAQAARDTDLVELAARCHPQTLRQVRWANAMLKESCAQILVG
jgi:hypothetical protein